MKPANLFEAIAAAEIFLRKAEEVRERIRIEPHGEYLDGSQFTASARRASMDLTRALARMRRP